MTCEEYRQLHILAQEDEPASPVMREHFEGCGACQSFVRSQTVLRAQVRILAQYERAPESLRRLVGKMVEGHPSILAPFLRPRMRIAVFAATVLVAIVGYLGLQHLLNRGPTGERLVQQFVSDHSNYLPGREQIVSNSPQAVQMWFEGRLDFPVHVPHVSNARLEDARVCDIAGRKAALLHYRHESHQTLISLFVAKEPKSFEREPHPVSVVKEYQGYNASLWCKRGLVYTLVASIDEASLKQIEESVRRQVP